MTSIAPGRPATRKLSAVLLILAPLWWVASSQAVAQEPGRAYVTFGKSSVPLRINSQEILVQRLASERSAPVITALAASEDGQFLAAAGDDHAIRIIDVASQATQRVLIGHRDWIQTLVFSADSATLYSAGNDGQVIQWMHGQQTEPQVILELPYAVRSLSVSSQAGMLAIAGFAHEVTVLDLRTGQIKHRLRCDSTDQRCVRFSPDGKQLLCGGRNGQLSIWETDSGRLTSHFHEHRGRVSTAAFSSDGKRVTSVGIDRQLIQYDLTTQRVLVKQDLLASKLMSLCMINDDLIAVAGADNSVHLYDALAKEVVAELHGHEGTVAVMTPCGNLLASGSFDTTIRLWDLESIERAGVQSSKPVSAPIKMDKRLRIR